MRRILHYKIKILLIMQKFVSFGNVWVANLVHDGQLVQEEVLVEDWGGDAGFFNDFYRTFHI